MAKTQASVTAQQMTENWSSGLTSNIPKIREGVNRVSESPMEKAAANKDKWIAGINKSFANGSWENGLRKVSLQQWKDITSAKINTSLAAGVQAAQAKYQAIAGQLLSHINNGLPAINNMPSVTLQDSANRMVTWMNHMAGFQRN